MVRRAAELEMLCVGSGDPGFMCGHLRLKFLAVLRSFPASRAGDRLRQLLVKVRSRNAAALAA